MGQPFTEAWRATGFAMVRNTYTAADAALLNDVAGIGLLRSGDGNALCIAAISSWFC